MKTILNHIILFTCAMVALFVITLRIILPDFTPLAPVPIPLLAAILTLLAGIVLAVVSPRLRACVGRIKTLFSIKAGWLVPLLVIFFTITTAPRARAADFAVQKTVWSFAGTWTNVVGATTNLNAAVDCTQVTDFDLQVVLSGTNADLTTTLGYTIAWQTSDDNSNWGTLSTGNGGAGWFSVPATNALPNVWHTNITMNARGYWRVSWATNSAGQCLTNVQIKAYIKPKRTNRDY